MSSKNSLSPAERERRKKKAKRSIVSIIRGGYPSIAGSYNKKAFSASTLTAIKNYGSTPAVRIEANKELQRRSTISYR